MQSDSTILAKTCSRCGVEKPATVEFYSERTDYAGRLRGACRVCRSSYFKAYRADHLQHKRECDRAYAADHMEAAVQRVRAWRAKHPQRKRDTDRARYLVTRREVIARASEWQAANPDSRKATHNRRRALMVESPCAGLVTAEWVKEQGDRQRGRCYWCRTRLGTTTHLDHVVPLSRGGTHGPENLVIACPTCNLSKGAKHPMDFAGRLF